MASNEELAYTEAHQLFRKYDKIHRLGKEETEGILDGTVYVQEKIDGANTSVWLQDGVLQCGSRNRHLVDDDFNGFVSYVTKHGGFAALLEQYPSWILYGEWLVKHTVSYLDSAYRQWYGFDIYNTEKHEYVHCDSVQYYLRPVNLLTPYQFGKFENPTVEQLKTLVGQSTLAPKGEGIVIKNPDFTNKFGDLVYAKLVHDEFLESAALVFGGNNKHAENYHELYIIQKYMTAGRVEKLCHKLQPEVNEKLDMKHIPRITNTAYHDMITEESWEIAKLNKPVDYPKLKSLAMKKAKLLYLGVLENAS